MAGMRWWRMACPRTVGGRRLWRPFFVGTLLMLAGALAACGTPRPSLSAALPGGTYTSAQYHFSITYPTGWQANVAPAPSPVSGASPTVPLTLIITRTSDTQGNVDLDSNLTIMVLDASDPIIAPSVAALAKDTNERHVTIGGLPAYADPPATQQVQGSSVTDTHTTYYVLANGYEYQITTDALSSDNAAPVIAQMLSSFKITKK